MGVQWGYSGGTMYPNFRSPKEEGIYLDRRRFQEFHAATRSLRLHGSSPPFKKKLLEKPTDTH